MSEERKRDENCMLGGLLGPVVGDRTCREVRLRLREICMDGKCL